MNIKLITVTSHPEHCTDLIKSAEKHGWDLILIHAEWKGFGTKIIELKRFLDSHPEIEYFIFCDSFDVLVLDSPPNLLFKDEIIFSAEKNCWPDDSLRSQYPETESQFKFLNSGLYYAPREKWMKMVQENPVDYADDDQLYFTKLFLSNKYGISLDDGQHLFNNHSFVADGEYYYDNNRVLVRIDGRNAMGKPILVHFNGRTVDPEFDKNITI